jgi:hypothetical protein
MEPSIRFSGNAAHNIRIAANVLQNLNAYAPQVVQLVNNGIDLYTAIQRVVSLFNSQHNQDAQVEHSAHAVQPQGAAPIIRTFWDYNYSCFRLAQWNYQYQQWQWIS